MVPAPELSVIEFIEKGQRDDNPVNDYSYCGLCHPDTDCVASGGQGRKHGRRLRRIQPDRFRFQRRWNFSGKSDGGCSHSFHADVYFINLHGIQKNNRTDGGSIDSRNQTGSSLRSKTGGSARWAGGSCKSAGRSGGKIKCVLFISANRENRFSKEPTECGGHLILMDCRSGGIGRHAILRG